MRKIIPVVVIALLLAICIVVPAESSDASDSRTDSFRVSNIQLLYFQTKALTDAQITENSIFVYEVGQDTSMKNYIADHSIKPEKGLTTITKDTTYEVYYYSSPSSLTYFAVGEWTLALDAYKYNFTVDKDTTNVVKVTKISPEYFIGSLAALSIKNDVSQVNYNVTESMTIKIGYIENSTYSVTPAFGNDALYYDGTMEVTILHYDASPLPFIIASIFIVILIGALVAYCGRKPKFD